MTGANKELAIEVNWSHLNAEQKAIRIDIVQAMARRNAMKSSAVDMTFSAKKEPKR